MSERQRGVTTRPEPTFRVPALSPRLVPRHRIISLLDLAVHQRLTIVAAPPGYGKTVALSQWALARPRQRVRWLTLTASDNDVATFTERVRGALGAKRADVAAVTRADLGEPDARRSLVAALVSDLERMPPTMLVLDDFHLIADPVLLDVVATLIDHAPRALRVVVSTRVDPPLRYYRLGLSDAIVALRQGDLAFTSEEATELIHRLTGTKPAAQLVDKLVERTEGWVVGLQLAALSLRERADVDEFVETFAGDDRHVADYLTEQVLQRERDATRDFLLSTCVLERMNGTLCDHLTGRRGGHVMLEELERRAMFITRLNGSRDWFRYHPLFRTFLRQHLHDEDPVRERELLRRAAQWHVDRDDPDLAVAYLADAADWGGVIGVATAYGRARLVQGRVAAVTHWLEPLPVAVREGGPDVALLTAAAAAFGGDGAQAEHVLQGIETRGSLSSAERVVAGLLRAYVALHEGAPATALRLADRAGREARTIEEADLPDVLGLTQSRADIVTATKVIRGVGLAYQGRFAEARAALDALPDGAHAMWQVSALGSRALLDAWSGRLSSAEQLGTATLTLAGELDIGWEAVTTDAYLALSDVARDRGDLARARVLLDDARRTSRSERNQVRSTLLATEEALLALAEGHPARGLRILAACRGSRQRSLPHAVLARRQAVHAQLLMMSGDLGSAARTLDAAPRDTSDVVATKVRLAVERGDVGTARGLIATWPADPDPRASLERRLWLAIIEHLTGDDVAARLRLTSVVSEAEREQNIGLFRTHHVFGPARSLYREAPTPFLRAIVDQPAPALGARPVKELVEQLTEREYAVLPLLPTRLSNVEIAETLGVSLNTVKTHLKHIYRKLGVRERSEAIAAAERLHLW